LGQEINFQNNILLKRDVDRGGVIINRKTSRTDASKAVARTSKPVMCSIRIQIAKKMRPLLLNPEKKKGRSIKSGLCVKPLETVRVPITFSGEH
jgi:hypothetical protein